MATATKLVSMRPDNAKSDSPLTPELREFLDETVVPLLVRKFQREKTLAVAQSPSQNAEPTR